MRFHLIEHLHELIKGGFQDLSFPMLGNFLHHAFFNAISVLKIESDCDSVCLESSSSADTVKIAFVIWLFKSAIWNNWNIIVYHDIYIWDIDAS